MKNLMTIVTAIAVTIQITGCSDGDSKFSLLPTQQDFVQSSTFNNELDILFVINAEPSMSSFQAELVASFQSFMNIFQSKGFDYKIAVVTSSGYLADLTLNGYDPVNIDAADFNDYNGTTHSNAFVITPLDPNLLSNFAINAKPAKNPAGQDGRAFSSFRSALQNIRPIIMDFFVRVHFSPLSSWITKTTSAEMIAARVAT